MHVCIFPNVWVRATETVDRYRRENEKKNSCIQIRHAVHWPTFTHEYHDWSLPLSHSLTHTHTQSLHRRSIWRRATNFLDIFETINNEKCAAKSIWIGCASQPAGCYSHEVIDLPKTATILSSDSTSFSILHHFGHTSAITKSSLFLFTYKCVHLLNGRMK